MKRIYLDYAATTPMHPEVLKVMQLYFTEAFGNPSSIYSYGQEAKAAMEEARVNVATLIGAREEEIVFTGSGLSTSFLAPVALMLYWPRFNRYGALAGMLGGFGTHVTLYAVGTILADGKVSAYKLFDFHPFMVGLLASMTLAVLVTLLTAPPPESLVRKYFYKDGGK